MPLTLLTRAARLRKFKSSVVARMMPVMLRPSWSRSARVDGDEVVMLVVSALRIDPRVEREARALVEGGFKVRIVAPDISTPSHREVPIDWGRGVVFDLLPFEAASYVMSEPWIFGQGMLNATLKYRPFAFHCHDLNTALIGLRAAYAIGAPCVCDFHEWHSENVAWDSATSTWVPHSDQVRRFFKWAERLVVRRADVVITVNRSIADALADQAGVPRDQVAVVRNIPKLNAVPTREYPSVRKQFNLREDDFVVLYQGGTGPTRALEPIIRSLAFSPRTVLVIRGPSLELFGDKYRELAAQIGAAERLILAPPVPSRDVVVAARGADAGIWSLPPLCRNFCFALPNKVFEYLAAELPLLAADYPEPARLIREYDVGETFDPIDPQSISSAIERLRAAPERLNQLRMNARKALQGVDADGEWRRLTDLYAGMAKRSTSSAAVPGHR